MLWYGEKFLSTVNRQLNYSNRLPATDHRSWASSLNLQYFPHKSFNRLLNSLYIV